MTSHCRRDHTLRARNKLYCLIVVVIRTAPNQARMLLRTALARPARQLLPLRRALATADLSVPPSTQPGKDLSETLRQKALKRDDEIRKVHEQIPESLETRRKRLIWRSKQRGWLEVDMLMGTWAVENVPKLNKEEMDQYENLLNLETLDLFNVVSKPVVEGVPANVQGPVLERIRQYARGFKSDPESYAKLIKPKMAN